MSKSYFRLHEVNAELRDIRSNGIARGESCGIVALDEFFSLKKGFPIFVAGSPYSGKTECTLEILMNTSILYGWKHFIYCGEGGDVQNIFAELIHKHAQKPFIKSGGYEMNDDEFAESMIFVAKHFVIANHDQEFTVLEFYKAVDQAEEELGFKFDTTTFDPFNDIKDETEMFGGREDKYLATALKIVRVNAKKKNRINILVNHIADVRAIVDKDSGNRYMPPALPNEWAGGRTWWRRGFQMILCYRPPSWLKDENGIPYAENESHIIIQKSKPKGVGKIGLARIFWDWKRNRYYSYDSQGGKYYSCETRELEKKYVAQMLEANTAFLADDKEEEFPF